MYFPKKVIKMSAATYLSLMLPLHMWWGNRGVLDHTSDVDGASSIQVDLGFSQNSGHWDCKIRQKKALL